MATALTAPTVPAADGKTFTVAGARWWCSNAARSNARPLCAVQIKSCAKTDVADMVDVADVSDVSDVVEAVTLQILQKDRKCCGAVHAALSHVASAVASAVTRRRAMKMPLPMSLLPSIATKYCTKYFLELFGTRVQLIMWCGYLVRCSTILRTLSIVLEYCIKLNEIKYAATIRYS